MKSEHKSDRRVDRGRSLAIEIPLARRGALGPGVAPGMRAAAHPLRSGIVPLVASALLGLAAVASAWCEAKAEPPSPTPCLQAERCRERLSLDGGGSIEVYRSLPLDGSPGVRRAVVVVHGNRRDADRYFERLVRAADSEKRIADVALIAPHFPTAGDAAHAQDYYWSSGGWKIGSRSRDLRRRSSFAVMDELLSEICGVSRTRLVGLEMVVLIGHSAGGQFVNRYLAGGAGCSDPAVKVRYVVMNPSSYLYLDDRRRTSDGDGFRTPVTHCRGFDDYKYGLRDLNRYMERVGVATIRRNVFGRESFYFAGEDDTKRGGSLDQSCAGDLQGRHRLARHRAYRAYHRLFEGWRASHFETIPGIGHSGGKMLRSAPVRRVVFR